MLPSFAEANARLSRSGNVVTLTSDARADAVRFAGTDNLRLLSFYVPRAARCSGPARAAPGGAGRASRGSS